MNKKELIEHYERKLLDMRCDDDEKICFSIKQRRDRKLKRELYNKFLAQIRALSITDVVVSEQEPPCTGCGRIILTEKDQCSGCRIADALLD